VIERNENIEATQRNKQAIENNKELYKRRQEIVEHPGVYPAERRENDKTTMGFRLHTDERQKESGWGNRFDIYRVPL